jgi:hypothetical protein
MKNAFIDANGVLVSWGYAESNSPGDTLIEVNDDFNLEIGKWKFEAGNWSSNTLPLADVKKQLSDSVDDSVARIYARFTRFSDEYRLREAEAQAFVASGYVGQAGELVTGYAVTQVDMTDQQAADIIIAQANALRTALKVLGNLRMRKNEIKPASVLDAAAAQAIHDEIIALAAAAVANL